MSITGKASLSLKKTDLIGQKIGASGQRKVVFAHKAVAGETGISLSSLTTPTEFSSVGFTQPSPALLAAANLKFFRNNLTLISSARGILQDFASYTVNNSTQINFTDSFGTALDGEIFTGIIDAVPRNDLVGVDSTSILASGTLAANTVQFNVGSAFKVNANPSTQIGEIAVYLDGKIQFRNVGNVTAAPSADGNYQEIDNGSSYGTLIEFNDVDIINDRSVLIVGTGISVIRPNGSLVQELESLAGQLDAMIPTLAAVAGVPESTFQAAPNNVDLKTFGDRVLGLEEPGTPGEPRYATTSVYGAVKGGTVPGGITAAASGYIGEKLTVTDTAGLAAGSIGNDSYTNTALTLPLTAGTWLVGFRALVEGTVGSISSRLNLSISGGVAGSIGFGATYKDLTALTVITLSQAETLTMQLRKSVGADMKMLGDNVTAGLTNPDNQNHIFAVRIG